MVWDTADVFTLERSHDLDLRRGFLGSFLFLGVHQKYLMVTCNYVARAQGVAKLTTINHALEKCPNLVLVNGEDLTFYREISYKATGNTAKLDRWRGGWMDG